jgi:enoyl-CoA hydratase
LENVLWQVEDGVGLLTFNRPAVLNALDARTLDELGQVIGEVARGAARGLILIGAGDRAFVAGADIAAMSGFSAEEARAFAERGQAVLDRLERLPVVTVAVSSSLVGAMSLFSKRLGSITNRGWDLLFRR